jgi:hypothetical protein
MRQKQWTSALAVLVAMVFGITFLVTYVSNPEAPDEGQGAGGGADENGPILSFLIKTYPDSIPGEHGLTGGQVFWFVNEEDRPIKMGMNRTSCRCASVQAAYFPTEVKSRFVPMLAFGGVGSLATNPDVVANLTDESAGGPLSVHELDNSSVVEIPGKTIGWVLMRWKGDSIGSQLLTAQVWMNNRNQTLNLEARVYFVEPVRLTEADRRRVVQSPLTLGRLPFEDNIFCWSSTRDHFDLEASVRGSNPTQDPFTVGKPVKLTTAECRSLTKQYGLDKIVVPVRSGYRVPITLREKGADGKTMVDLGTIRRWVSLKAPDIEPVEPILTSYEMTIVGDVQLNMRGEARTVDFGPFNRAQGSKTVPVSVWTDNPAVSLEVDRERTSPFIEAHLEEETSSTAQARRTWRINIKVRPNQAIGDFPRGDDGQYQDSAVYLKIKGGTWKSIRIPVQGSANFY